MINTKIISLSLVMLILTALFTAAYTLYGTGVITVYGDEYALNNDGDIEKYLDVDAALRYIAVSTALANFDSYQGSLGHNYYLYEQNGVFTILPWDLNMSFGG
ncbi:MAG: hypothetical protein CVU88_07740, partial [Firmicutes bacterium HGW-Firmicutes-13]